MCCITNDNGFIVDLIVVLLGRVMGAVSEVQHFSDKIYKILDDKIKIYIGISIKLS